MAEKSPPAPPDYLDAALRSRFEELAPELFALGTLTRLDVDALARYVVSEHEYLRVSRLSMQAISRGDAADADRWVSVQDRLLKQCLTAGAEFGLTPTARRSRGLILPNKSK